MPAGTALLSVALLVLASPAVAIDLTGKWQVEYEDASTEFVDVTDTAGVVTLTLNSVPSDPGVPLPLAGTFTEATLGLSLSSPGTLLTASVLSGGDDFDGRLGFAGLTPPHRVLARRCQCFDGNTQPGDGCDSQCRIEPCFSSPDGNPCTDSSPCTVGETCAAGVCSGKRIGSCVDLSGTWDRTILSDFPPQELVSRIEQHDDVVLFRDAGTNRPDWFGTIVPESGVLRLKRPQRGLAFCIGTDPMLGSAALDGLSFEASGHVSSETFTCVAFAFTETAVRQCPGAENDPFCAGAASTLPPAASATLFALLALGVLWRLNKRGAS